MKNYANIIKIAVARAINLAETKLDEKGNETYTLFDKNGEKKYCKHGHLHIKKTADGLYKYDTNGSLIYHKDLVNKSEWFYKDNKVIRWKTPTDDTRWNESGDCIYYKSATGEYFYENGNIAREILADGTVKNYLYDGYGEKIAMLDNYGNEERYDQKGRTIFERRNDGAETITEYDSVGHIIYRKEMDGTERRYKYDSEGVLIYYKDADGEEYICIDNEMKCISTKRRVSY